MDYLQAIHRLIVQNEREIRALKSRLAQVASGSTILSSAVALHGLLSATHPDTVPGGPVEGAVIVGNAMSLWERVLYTAAAAGNRKILGGEGGATAPSFIDLFNDGGIFFPGTSPYAARKDHDHEAIVSGGSDDTVKFDASGMTDAVTTEFDMPDFFVEDSTLVFLNGMLQRPIFDYTEGTDFDTIVMVAAPEDNDELVVVYVAQEAP